MAKYMIVDNNPLEIGMEFVSLRAAGKFVNCKDINHSNVVASTLSHYCDWHRNEENKIIIDNVFDKVKPFRTNGFKYNVGEIIEVPTGSYEILKRYYTPDKYRKNVNSATYLCRCLIHNDFEFELTENRIAQGIGCPLCGKHKIIPGIRSLYDCYPELMKYVVDIDGAKRTTPNCHKKILCKCPLCSTEREITVNNLVKHGFSCHYCSDHISYPNKFVRCFLKQLNIKFIPEKSFNWSNGKLYDQYLTDLNIIIENHGLQHYEECSGFMRTLEEEIENDRLKEKLALDNKINEYIVLDCRESNKDFIKSSILSSELSTLLNFNSNDIDWEYCDEIASTNSEFLNVCDTYNNISKNMKEVAEITQHDIHTVIDYIAKAASFGYCDYEKNVTSKELKSNILKEINCKPIYCVTDNIYFYSKTECEQYYKSHGIEKFNGRILYKYIKNGTHYYSKLFKYITKQEYNRFYDDDNYIVIGKKYNKKYIKEE